MSFAPGTLWSALVERTRRALDCGALLPIETTQEWLEDGSARFLVRVVSSLVRKEAARTAGGAANPFLPYEPELFVSDVSATHVALLNKFNVIDHHLLVVTRRFEHQECLLDSADFAALWSCMAEYPSLGFYNGGAAAGASQTHKHLQLVPLPMADEGPAVPIEPRLGDLPFAYSLTRLEPDWGKNAAGVRLYEIYRSMLTGMGIEERSPGRQSAPYNLLLTREWMLLVPRSCEHCGEISINGLGYAGSLFVRNRDQLATLQRIGPLSALRSVAF